MSLCILALNICVSKKPTLPGAEVEKCPPVSVILSTWVQDNSPPYKWTCAEPLKQPASLAEKAELKQTSGSECRRKLPEPEGVAQCGGTW